MDINPLLRVMAEKNASDLYFAAGAPAQMKIDGNTIPVNTQILNGDQIKQIAYRMMNTDRINQFEEDWEMNFGYPIDDVGNFRVNVYRQKGDIGIVIRYIRSKIPTIRELNLPPILESLIMEKLGLVLVVGSTGSGKSTTLASMIEHRSCGRSGHILTIEDPVEFIFQHRKSIVSQREIGIDTRSFHNALINAMREAPDMLMIGEIRDRETMQHAIAYAQAGHLTLSTLHANNSYHVMNRIINFFPLETRDSLLMDLSVCLRAVISQRLVRTQSGKLIPAIEVMLNTPRVAELIRTGEIDQIREAMENSMSEGSQTFEQSLFRLYKSGKISLDEALDNADSSTNLSWLINNDGKAHQKAEDAQQAANSADMLDGPSVAFDFRLKVDDDMPEPTTEPTPNSIQ